MGVSAAPHREHVRAPHGYTRADWRSTAAAATLACLVLLPLLGHRPLTAWDEGIYAEIAREMLTGHSFRAWLIPHWNGQLWFEKPPLTMWLMAISLRLFGVTTIAARVPSAIAGVATVTLLHTWSLRRLGRVSATLGTLVLLCCFGFQHAARAGETDTLLSLFCLLATLGLCDVLAGSSRGWLLFWGGFGCAVMTKGAATLPLALTPVLLLLPGAGRGRLLRFGHAFFLGLALFCCFALPWHLFLLWHFGSQFLDPYLGFHVLARATTAIEGHRTGPFFYAWVLLVSAPPFALLYPWALWDGLRTEHPIAATKPAMTRTSMLRPLALFALGELVVFSLARTRLPHYIAPAYPPLSLLTATWLARLLQTWGLRRTRRDGLVLATLAVLIVVVAALATGKARRALHNPRLPNGEVTPDNREETRLLMQARPQIAALPGPLLLWRHIAHTPVTTDAFYGRHLVQQVMLDTPPAGAVPRNPYTFSPVPLREALDGAPSAPLLLLDRELSVSLPHPWRLQPIVSGPNVVLARVTKDQPAPEVGQKTGQSFAATPDTLILH